MRPWVAVLSVAAMLMLSSAAGAAVHEYLGGAHWNVTAGRPGAVLVVDATDDPRAQEALRGFKATWNAMRAHPSLAMLPLVALSTARPAQVCSSARLREGASLPGHVVVCLDDGLATAAVGGPYRVDAHGHTTVGVVKLRRRTLTWAACNLRTAVAHELGHVMGLAHNDSDGFTGGPSVMMSGKRPYGYGCPAWFNAHDRAALRVLYGEHAAIRSAAAGLAPAAPSCETPIRPGTP